jgi:predicted ATP-grasp superfamily ATP-dependent carboligase
MTIEEKKSAFIEEFKNLSNEKLIDKMESFLKDLKAIEYQNTLKPFSEKDFNKMIDQAIEQHKSGNVISHDDLLEQIKSW